jgi:hypothetical protein
MRGGKKGGDDDDEEGNNADEAEKKKLRKGLEGAYQQLGMVRDTLT